MWTAIWQRLLLTLTLLSSTGPAWALTQDNLSINLEATPDLASVSPDLDQVKITLTIKDAAGKPVHGAAVHVELTAPATSPWVSTSFPIVEGTKLFSGDLVSEQGQVWFSLVPPIRGKYDLSVAVATAGGPATAQHLEMHVSENPHKVRMLTLLIGILTAVGLISGVVIGRSSALANVALRAGSAAALIISVTLWAVPERLAFAHTDHDHGDHGADTSSKSPGVTMTPTADHGTAELHLDSSQPRVGVMAALSGARRDSTGKAVPSRVHLSVTNLEDKAEVFATDILAPNGTWTWQGQFYDGAPHQVRASYQALAAGGEAGGQAAASAELVFDVEAIHPPTQATAKAFGLLMLITIAAMAAGYAAATGWFGSRRTA